MDQRKTTIVKKEDPAKPFIKRIAYYSRLFWRKKHVFIPVILTVLLVCTLVIRLFLTKLAVETNYRLESEDEGILGANDLSKEWNFSDPLDYKVSDSDKVQVVGGIAELISIDQQDSDDSSAGFGGGTYVETQWNGTSIWLELTAAGLAGGAGDFTSRVIDSGGTNSWTQLDWQPQRPLYKELLSNAAIETAYSEGNVSMSGNVLLMHLNETSGTSFTDVSGAGNNGSCTNCPSPGVTGKLNTALDFGGSNRVDISESTAMNFTSAVSYGAWFNADSFDSWAGVLSRMQSWPNGYNLQVGNSNRIACGWGQYTTSDSMPVTGQWYHAVCVYDGTQMRLYVNGVLQSDVDSGVLNQSTVDMKLGVFYTSPSLFFDGRIDEVFVFNRALGGSEVLDMYKRGAVRLLYQVRSCDDDVCDTESFIGPDGTGSTYYSELSNASASLPSLSLTNVPDNRYFQYKSYFQTDNSSYSPELKSVSIGPDHYPSGELTVENGSGPSFTKLNSFKETLGPGNGGVVKYQISNDGTSWYYYTSGKWSLASGGSQTNTVAEANSKIESFSTDVGKGDFYFKAFLVSEGAQEVQLDKVNLTYDLSSDDNGGDDDDDDQQQTSTTYITSGKDPVETIIEVLTETGETVQFQIYTVIVNDHDDPRILMNGAAIPGSVVIVKLGGKSIATTYAESDYWELEFSISDIEDMLKLGRNAMKLEFYDRDKELIGSKDIYLLVERDSKFEKHDEILGILDYCMLALVVCDSVSLIYMFGVQKGLRKEQGFKGNKI